MSTFTIKTATRDEFRTAVEWAAQEGWNPGLDDLDAFYLADPEGFLMGFVDDFPVSSISVVRYGDHFGFLGFYIVHPDYRGRGFGMATWNAGMAHLGDRTIALDGVVDQQDNYRRSGFDYVSRNVRYAGIPTVPQSTQTDITTRALQVADLSTILRFDRQCFPADRHAFISNWCLAGTHRTSHVAELDGELVGFGTIRACNDGYKLGPLFVLSADAATSLMGSLTSVAKQNETIILDVPEINAPAVEMAIDFGLEPVFETARMVRGTPPDVDWSKVFGITSFELG